MYLCTNNDIYCRITNIYNNMSKTVHLINEAGDRIEVGRKDFSKSELLNEQKYSNYDIDVDWYLNNGYSLAEDMFRRIESNGNNK